MYQISFFLWDYTTGSLIVLLEQLHLKGYWHQRADKRHGNPHPREPGTISGQRQSWRTPGELGVSKSMECDIVTSVF